MNALNWLVPARRRGHEALDDPATDERVRARAMTDLVVSNTLFGGRAAVVRAARALRPELAQGAVLLDVGTGHAEIAASVRAAYAAAGTSIAAFGLDIAESVARTARRRVDGTLVGDVRRLPVRDASVDLVTCSQLLHHFESNEARAVVAELQRASRGWVIISDLRRSWLAAAGFWLASLVLGFHPVTRHDGVVSVFRGFTVSELATLVREVTGVTPRMRRGAFWRVTATWRAR